MPSCNTYCLTWVSLTLDEGYLLTAAPPDLERGIAPLGPLGPMQPLLFGCVVAPRTWGCSLDVGLHLQAASPDLRGGIAPLGHCP